MIIKEAHGVDFRKAIKCCVEDISESLLGSDCHFHSRMLHHKGNGLLLSQKDIDIGPRLT